MRTSRLPSLTFVIAALISVFALPLNAFATGQTAVTASGSTVTQIAAGDQLNVTLDGPILTVGQTSQRLTAEWSPSSLQLKDNNITYPAGWGLEYSTDGSTWSSSVPSDLTTVVAIRASGTVNATGANVFSTQSAGTAVAVTTSFSGSSGGDGLNLIFAGDRVFNIFHHSTSLVIDCHLVADGAACYSPTPTKTFSGYYTGNASQGYWDEANKKLYAQTAKLVSGSWKLGVTCVDYSAMATPVLCATPWVELGSTTNTFGSAGNDIGTSAQLGTKIFIPNVNTWK